MDFISKISESLTEMGKEVSGKARELAEVARLKSQISTCEEVIKKNYLEIGRLFEEQYRDDSDAPFEKQREAIRNARKGVEELQARINEIKGV